MRYSDAMEREAQGALVGLGTGSRLRIAVNADSPGWSREFILQAGGRPGPKKPGFLSSVLAESPPYSALPDRHQTRFMRIYLDIRS
jgi:hypothetical protein